MQYIIPDGVYKVLKWAGVIVFPALATFVGTVGEAWGMEAAGCDACVTTLNAIGTLMGAVLVASAATAKPADGGDA